MVIGSPPCTDFSMFDELDKDLHRGDPAWLRPSHENLDKAKRHVRCCGTIYKHQVRQGRSFPHEHPWLARSWGMECIKEVEALQGVVRVRLDMFQYGMTSRIDKVGCPLGPVLKPTGMLTNSYYLQRELPLRCPKNHEHVHLVGGRTSAAQEHPKGLCEATCRGLAAQKAVDLSRRFTTLPMDSKRIGSLSLLCCEAAGELGNHDWPGAIETPVGSYPVSWADNRHDHDGHFLRSAPRDKSGEEALIG